MTPPRIRLLSAATVNRIAAGEVIERPAAAARELVENALDAGAGRIAVAIEGGGAVRIEVTDDGVGMSEAELGLCVLRHATSKLAETAAGDELVHIATLGFRGEALPSIGAAARLSITSRQAGSGNAAAITVEGGVVGDVRPAAGAVGTRVTVRDLFFATPARRKFLKSPRAEADATEAAIRRLALAACHVAFRFESDGRVAFDLPPQDRAQRIAALLGPEAAAALLPVTGERGELRLTGFACAATATRATAAAQALVVNGRPVVDPVLRTAVRVAYRQVIAPGRFPVVALYLDIPSEDVDVNVHPAKAELRFRDPEAVRSLVIGSLGRALASGAGPAAPAIGFSHLLQSRPTRPGLHLVPTGPRPTGMAEASLPLDALPGARMVDRAHGPFTAAAPADFPAERFPLGAAVAQVLDTYIIAVAGDGSLVLVDQHAAHERLTHEALRGQMLAGGVRSQPLLLPGVVDMPAADAAAAAGAGRRVRAAGPGDRGIRRRRNPGAGDAGGARGAGPGAAAARPRRRTGGDGRDHRPGRAHGRGDRPHGLPRQHPRRAAAGGGRDGRDAAPDGGDPARRHLQPWPPDLPEAVQGGDRAPIRPPLTRPGRC